MEFGTFSFTILGGYKKFLDPPHTLTILVGTTIHLTRKRFIFPGRYLKADLKNNWTWVVGHSKMLKGGLKNYDQPKSPITWVIIAEFDNLAKFKLFNIISV